MSKNFFGILIVVLLIVTNVSLVLAEENATFLIQNPMLDNGEYSPLGEVPVIIGFGDSLEDKIAELSPEMEGHGPYAVATVSATEVGDKTIFLFKCENGLFL